MLKKAVPALLAFFLWPVWLAAAEWKVVIREWATPDDRLYLACSGVNKVAVAEPSY
jgi:hypothetical protein